MSSDYPERTRGFAPIGTALRETAKKKSVPSASRSAADAILPFR
jgi:hypothetical protein